MFGVSLSPQLETDPRPVTEQFSQASGGNRQRLMGWSPLPEPASECQSGIAIFHKPGEATVNETKTIGMDLAKNVI